MPRANNRNAVLIPLRQIARDKRADAKTRLEAAKLLLELTENQPDNTPQTPKARQNQRSLRDLIERVTPQTADNPPDNASDHPQPDNSGSKTVADGS